eukprot:m.146114 g.146114  ORF g.146114 m.146114 type:complete len:670 (+) comp11642_c5_seq1:625-2634(+)
MRRNGTNGESRENRMRSCQKIRVTKRSRKETMTRHLSTISKRHESTQQVLPSTLIAQWHISNLADWATRADQRWIKGYLRKGIAERALGRYSEAVASFKAGRGYSVGKDRLMFERHIEDTELAQQLAEREAKLMKEAERGDGADTTFQAIELACSKFQHSALNARAFAVGADMVAAAITTEAHRDFFRLRGGTTLLHSAPTVKDCIAHVIRASSSDTNTNTSIDMGKHKATTQPNPHTGEENTPTDAAAAVSAALRLLLKAVDGNEASRRDVVRRGKPDACLLASLLASAARDVAMQALCLMAALVESPRVGETLLKVSDPPIVPSVVHAILRGDTSVTTGTPPTPTAVVKDTRADGAGVAVLAALARLPGGSRRVGEAMVTTLGPWLVSQLDTPEPAPSRAVGHMMTLVGDAHVRSWLAAPSTVQRLVHRAVALASPPPPPAAAASGRCAAQDTVDMDMDAALGNTLGLLCNVCLEARAQSELQQPAIVRHVTALLQHRVPAVVARAAQLLSRLCTSATFATQLVTSGSLACMIKARRIQGPHEEEILDAVVRTMTKCLRMAEGARPVVNDCGGISMLLPALKASSPALIGNAALCIADLAQDKDSCAAVADTTIVADLLTLARGDKSAMTENFVIALSRLAAGHPAHLARLRSLDGFEVLHARAPKT